VERQTAVVKTACNAVLGVGAIGRFFVVLLATVVLLDAVKKVRSLVMILGTVFRQKLRL
jgi:hypothetical protein